MDVGNRMLVIFLMVMDVLLIKENLIELIVFHIEYIMD